MVGIVKKNFFAILACLLCLLILIPFYMFFINSLKTTRAAAEMNLSLPKVFQFVNFVNVNKEAHIWNAFKNSIFITGTTVALTVIISSMTGYVIQRKNTKTTQIIYTIILLGMIIPGFIIPTYILAHNLHLTGTLWGMILVSTTGSLPFSIFLYTGFFKTIPRDLDESAILDGCSPLALFTKIVIPLLKPITMTIIIINFLGVWNDFGTSIYFLNKESRYSLVMTSFMFFQTNTADWNLVFADLVIVCVPVLIVYIILQRYVISGMTSGSLKG